MAAGWKGSVLMRPAVSILLQFLLLSLLSSFLSIPVDGFRFTARPGRKCFTEELPEAGRYELHYRMTRSLTPFVSVAVTAPGGRAVVEHHLAKPNTKEIVTADSSGTIAICFNVAQKVLHSATSLNITLEITDAEDAELTRQKQNSYSLSNPIAVGVGKASGAMQQMDYIFHTTTQIRHAYTSLMRVDDDIRHSLEEMKTVSWNYLYVFAGVAVLIPLGTYLRLRRYLILRKFIS